MQAGTHAGSPRCSVRLWQRRTTSSFLRSTFTSAYDGLDAFDALLAAVARREGASALVSADRAFAAVKRLPFVELGSPEFDQLVA
jgi:hypothetical protein